MVKIVSAGTALPENRYTNIEIAHAVRSWLQDDLLFQRFSRLQAATRVSGRSFVIPPSEIVSQKSNAARASAFEEYASSLGAHALEAALQKSSLARSDIDGIIFTSCTCPVIPAPDVRLIELMGLRRDLARLPMYQYGCAGGVRGISLAASLDCVNLAVVSVELCSLVFQPGDTSMGALVGASLFGDGAAACIVSKSFSGPLTILGSQSYLVPGTGQLMGYDIRDTGPHLRLDRELPALLQRSFKEILERFLSRFELAIQDIQWCLFHPGSEKIVRSLEEELQLTSGQIGPSLEVLYDIGNLSSATILFVLNEFLENFPGQPGDFVLIAGIGPGLTIELILAQYSGA